MADGDDIDNDLLLGLLTGAIIAPTVALPVDRETVLFVVVICCCRCFGGVATLAIAGCVFVCCGGDDDVVADMSGVADMGGMLMIVKVVLLFLEYRKCVLQLY
jgi:hypothetical protein